jgi:hypothetical protein
MAQHTQRIRGAALENVIGISGAQACHTEASSLWRAGGQVGLAKAAA